MFFYKQIDETGELLLLLTYDTHPTGVKPNVVEITEEEYAKLMAGIASSPQTGD